MTDDQILHICKEVANGRGRHGSFLMRFAECVISADPSNFAIVKSAAVLLIGKYELDRYLDNFPSTDGFPPDPEPDPAKRVRS
jgi:hypothetical protein